MRRKKASAIGLKARPAFGHRRTHDDSDNESDEVLRGEGRKPARCDQHRGAGLKLSPAMPAAGVARDEPPRSRRPPVSAAPWVNSP